MLIILNLLMLYFIYGKRCKQEVQKFTRSDNQHLHSVFTKLKTPLGLMSRILHCKKVNISFRILELSWISFRIWLDIGTLEKESSTSLCVLWTDFSSVNIFTSDIRKSVYHTHKKGYDHSNSSDVSCVIQLYVETVNVLISCIVFGDMPYRLCQFIFSSYSKNS